MRLRPAAESDIAPLTALAAHPEVARWWGDNDEDDIRIEICAPRAIAWAIEVDGELSGLVVATEENEPDYRSVELDLFLAGDRLDRASAPTRCAPPCGTCSRTAGTTGR